MVVKKCNTDWHRRTYGAGIEFRNRRALATAVVGRTQLLDALDEWAAMNPDEDTVYVLVRRWKQGWADVLLSHDYDIDPMVVGGVSPCGVRKSTPSKMFWTIVEVAELRSAISGEFSEWLGSKVAIFPAGERLIVMAAKADGFGRSGTRAALDWQGTVEIDTKRMVVVLPT